MLVVYWRCSSRLPQVNSSTIKLIFHRFRRSSSNLLLTFERRLEAVHSEPQFCFYCFFHHFNRIRYFRLSEIFDRNLNNEALKKLLVICELS